MIVEDARKERGAEEEGRREGTKAPLELRERVVERLAEGPIQIYRPHSISGFDGNGEGTGGGGGGCSRTQSRRGDVPRGRG